MCRIAELPSPWRYIVIALLVLAALLLLRWLDEEDESSVSFRRAGCDQLVDVHFKLRPGATTALDAKPLFTHLPQTAAATDDPRARWRRLDVPASQAAAVVAALEHDPSIEEAFVAPEISLPQASDPMDPFSADVDRLALIAPGGGDSCPITTPSFEDYQGYVGPAPQGIDAPAAWRRGVRGQGIWFADVEGGWNACHEDLPGNRITHVAGQPINDPMWRQHGTAVLGEVVGRDNGKGVVGLAPDVERVFTASIGRLPVADALDAAAERLRPGDVLLIELQSGGPRGRFLPIEFWDDNFDAIQAATRRGVVVIEAAGNGGEDLDHKTYKGKLSRPGRDSGAIMVGAGAPARDGYVDRARLDFSNYGSRVDVQGWGRKVATLDYGDLQRCDDPGDRHYTGEFSGTSSASPIVAGAAVLLESWAKQTRGAPLAPAVVRDLLTRTGTPQADGIGGSDLATKPQQIGPRPDLERALQALER
jgi:subtilisin family serine protease